MLEVCPLDYAYDERDHPARVRNAIRPNSTQPLAPRSAAHMPCRTHSEYQNKVETTYALLPRPPQTPAAPFKRLYPN